MSNDKNYKCENCGETFDKGELNKGKLPSHDFKREGFRQYRGAKHCGFSGRSAVKIK